MFKTLFSLDASSVRLIICLSSRIENEEIFSQIVGVSKNCDQNGDKVSKYNKICYISSMIQKGLLVKMIYWELGLLA